MKPQVLYLTLLLSSSRILLLIGPCISRTLPGQPQVRPLDRMTLPILLYRRLSSPRTVLKILLIIFPLALPSAIQTKGQRSNVLLDVPVRSCKRSTCPIIASPSKRDMECGSRLAARRQPQALGSNSFFQADTFEIRTYLWTAQQ